MQQRAEHGYTGAIHRDPRLLPTAARVLDYATGRDGLFHKASTTARPNPATASTMKGSGSGPGALPVRTEALASGVEVSTGTRLRPDTDITAMQEKIDHALALGTNRFVPSQNGFGQGGEKFYRPPELGLRGLGVLGVHHADHALGTASRLRR